MRAAARPRAPCTADGEGASSAPSRIAPTRAASSRQALREKWSAPRPGSETSAAASAAPTSQSSGSPSWTRGRSVRYTTKSHPCSSRSRPALSSSGMFPSAVRGKVSRLTSTVQEISGPERSASARGRSSATRRATFSGSPGSARTPTVSDCTWPPPPSARHVVPRPRRLPRGAARRRPPELSHRQADDRTGPVGRRCARSRPPLRSPRVHRTGRRPRASGLRCWRRPEEGRPAAGRTRPHRPTGGSPCPGCRRSSTASRRSTRRRAPRCPRSRRPRRARPGTGTG